MVEYVFGSLLSDGAVLIAAQSDPVEAFGSLSALERAGIQFGATILLGLLVLGLTPEYGTSSVSITHRSPVISGLIGVLVAPVLGGLLWAGWLIVDAEIGVFFAVLLICISGPLLAVWTAIGFVGIGGFLARRAGLERQWTWVLVGSAVGGATALVAPVGVGVAVIAAVFGCGAGVRGVARLVGSDGPDERTVPPANKV